MENSGKTQIALIARIDAGLVNGHGQGEMQDGAACRIRTDDLPLTRRLLYQLS